MKKRSLPTESDQPSENSSPSTSLTPLLSKKEQKILGNDREIEWLKRQIEDLEGKLHPRAAKREIPDSLNMEDLYNFRLNIEDQQRQLLDISNIIFNKENITSSIYHQYFTKEALYPAETDNLDEVERKRAVEQSIMERDRLVTELMAIHQQIQIQKQELDQVQKKISVAEEDARRMFKINKDYKPTPEQQLENNGLLEREAEVQDQVEITRKVLQNLMLESQYDWASDPHWLEVMLRIGDDFDVSNYKKDKREEREVEDKDSVNENDTRYSSSMRDDEVEEDELAKSDEFSDIEIASIASIASIVSMEEETGQNEDEISSLNRLD